MDVVLYKTNSPKNLVTKKLTNEKRYTDVVFLEAVDNTNPTIDIGFFEKVDELRKYNYAYIPQFGRYYYISPQTFKTGGIVSLTLSVDVLMTYKDSILNSTQLIDRVQSKGKMYIGGYDWVTDERTYVRTYKFDGDHFNKANDSYVLVTV